jgi:hypothetical protein
MSLKDTLGRLLTPEQRYEPNPLQRAALSSLLITSVSGSVVILLAVGRWLDMSTPSWMLLLGSLPITLVSTLMATSHEDKLSVPRLIGPALVSLGIALSLGVGLGLMWREDGVRRQAVEFASERELSPVLLGAMRGGGPELGALACKKLADSKREELRLDAFDGLLTHPSHFSACLEDSSLHDEWGKRLVDGWMASLKAGTSPETICAWSDTLAQATEEVPGAAMALMSCALDDTSAPHQTCCIRAMKEKQWVGDRLASRLHEARPNPVYERAMSVAVSAQLADKGGQDIGMQDSEMLKRYGYASMCRSMNLENLALASGLTNMAIERCKVREKSLREDTSFWISVCGDLVMDASRQEDTPIEGLFCEETRRRMVSRASQQASLLLHAATLTPQTQELYKMEKLAGVIHNAARASGFVPSDSTGIVGQHEHSRYSRSADNQAIHKLGERNFKKRLKGKKKAESTQDNKAFNRAFGGSTKHLDAPRQRKINNDIKLKDLMGDNP